MGARAYRSGQYRIRKNNVFGPADYVIRGFTGLRKAAADYGNQFEIARNAAETAQSDRL